MATEQLANALTLVVPDWEMRPPDNPPGNTLAGAIRYVMDDTRSVFGESTYSTPARKDTRWRSLMKDDYTSCIQPGRAVSAPHNTPREERPRALSIQGRPEMFNTWKVPDRITTSEGSRGGSRTVRRDPVEPSPVPQARVSYTPRPQQQFPQIERPHGTPRKTPQRATTCVPHTPRIDRGMASLKMQPDTAILSPRAHVHNTMTPRADTGQPMSSRKPRSYKVSKVLENYYTPSQSAESWIKHASETDRHLVNKALILLTREKASKKDFAKSIQTWLRTANERDRVVALEFFRTLTSDTLAGENPDQKEKLRTIMAALERGRKWPGQPDMHNQPTEEDYNDRFRYIRLLTPTTRRDRWQHQTWHHLPSYNDNNAVINKSAIYTQPSKPIPRSYVIHPDLG